MALTLAQSALLSEDDLQRGVIETFVLESYVLDRLPLLGIEGNAYKYNSEGTLPGVEFRAVNSAYAESTGTVNQASEGLVILGGDADVDTFLVKTRGNLNDQRAVQTRMKIKAAVMKFQSAFINGDVADDANSFDGLKKRLTGNQVVDAGGIGPVSDGHDFFDLLDEAQSRLNGPASAFYLNKSIRSKIISAARRSGSWQQRIDDFGRPIDSYNGIPLLDIGTNADGTDIIPLTEGDDANESSIYAVRFGEDEADGGVTGLNNGGIDVRDLGEIDAKPVYRTRIEFFCGLAVFSGRAAVRIKAVKRT